MSRPQHFSRPGIEIRPRLRTGRPRGHESCDRTPAPRNFQGLTLLDAVHLLVERAVEDDRLRQRLLMKAARKAPKGLDLALMEHALATVEEAMGSVDDSDGHMSGIRQRLQEIHRAACKKAKPDPGTLAKRLFEWELRTEWDTFFDAAEKYAGVLGKQGLAVYRKLAEAEWASVPALEPGRDDPERYRKRFRITHIMETLARRSGDVEAVVAVKKRDLSSAYAYLQIAARRQAGEGSPGGRLPNLSASGRVGARSEEQRG